MPGAGPTAAALLRQQAEQRPRSAPAPYAGPIPAGALTVEVVSCTGLLVADLNGKADPYVKVRMGKTTLQTRCIKKTLDPVFNQQLDPLAVGVEEQGAGHVLGVEVWDKDSGPGQDDFLGEVDVPL